jgi:Nucleotidyltransferase of unknown function (DUF6036)
VSPSPGAFARFEPTQLERFLTAVDAALTEPVFVIVLGGGAAALGYGVRTGTKDLDTLTELGRLQGAIEVARRKTGLDIPVEPTPVADLPYEFESRLVRVLQQLRKLELFVPEAHDLVLSKLVRAHAGDLAAIEQIHQHHPLSFDTLLRRYCEEMTHTIGLPERLDQNFLMGVDVVFGELKREEARRALRARIK